MFNEWSYNEGLQDAQSDYLAKLRASGAKPVPFGIGIRYVGKDTYFPTDAERKRATEISIAKGVVAPNTRWQTCASIDEVTGECSAFTIGQDAQPLPPWVLTETAPPPGIIPAGVPVRGIDQMPGGGGGLPGPTICDYPAPPTGCTYVQGPNYDSRTNCGLVLKCDQPPASACPPGQRQVGTTTSIPPRPICEPEGRSDTPSPVTPPITPAERTRRSSRQRVGTRVRAGAVELCPISGFVTRPIQGTSEYQVFRCTPGQRVRIDTGLQEAGIREAMQRQEVTRATAVTGSVAAAAETQPNWFLIGGIALGAVLLLRKR